ncbi:hypothetical protein H8N03_05210 [Ramlibacter sp. USB13]|uniref:Uncharacterized protein n=1 Tax=Ramlibacter cellulosilyticus TaxID=2764187 RepID=A0A923MNH5_9BURK|nr:hypothetical protein [Ramlibacter cellulosilyticus]MBC5782333.1 hypothetical protein [Ramlibacter cellulosilyticus]
MQHLRFVCVLLGSALSQAAAYAQAVPSEGQIDSIIKLCAAGQQYSASASISAALRDWRKGVLAGSIGASAGTIGSALQTVDGQQTNSANYATYTKCIADTLAKFLEPPKKSYQHLETAPLAYMFPALNGCQVAWNGRRSPTSYIFVGFRPAPRPNRWTSDGIWLDGPRRCSVRWDYLAWELIGLYDQEFMAAAQGCLTRSPVRELSADMDRAWRAGAERASVHSEFAPKLEAGFATCITNTTNIPAIYANRVKVQWFSGQDIFVPYKEPEWCDALNAERSAQSELIRAQLMAREPLVRDIADFNCIFIPPTTSAFPPLR